MKSRRAIWYFRALLALGGLLLATSTIATAAPPPPKIEYGPFEGEIAPLGSDDWTTGNISGYKEGDLVRFRLTLSSLTGTQDGHIFIAFTSDPACPFFAFLNPTDVAVDFDTTTDAIDGGSGFTAVFVPPLVQSGDNAVADFHVVSTSAPPSTVRLNFTLLLSDGAAGCATGSSQHVEVDSVSGDVKSTGKKTLPIPATAVAPVTDIEVLKDAPASAEIGDPISYTLTVTNLDQSTTAEAVVVTDTLPGGVTFVSGSWTKTSPSGGDTCSVSIDGKTVTCELGDLAGGATATVAINVTVNNDVALCGTTLTNSTSVSTTTLESDTGNNSAQDSTEVDACPGTLTVIKHVINDNGGTAVAADFTLDSGGANDTPDGFAGAEAPGTTVTLDAGGYTVTEIGPSGYTASYSADCSGTIANGQTKTCTITNDDIAPKLIVIKHVINNSGGTAVAGDFTMTVDDPGTNPASFAGAEAPGTMVTVDPGAYSVSESGPSGYAESQSADCSGSLAIGETKTCTITNDDAPAPLPGLCPTGSICAVNDVNTLDSRIFKYIPGPTDCGPLRLGANFEGLESTGGVLYAASGETSGTFANRPGGFYRVAFDTCELTFIGLTGFSDVEALAVNPVEGTMWGFGEDQGLFTIRDLTTGVGTLERPSSKKIEGLSWSLDGNRLYGVGDNNLWRYNCTTGTLTPGDCSAGSWVLVTSTLPGDEFEGLETSRAPWPVVVGHDVLILANHGNATLFWWDVQANSEIVSARLSTSGRNDVEGIVVCK